MPVVRRENPVTPPRPVRSASVEDVLRDAACFAASDDVSPGLAHRALARQIALQSRNDRSRSHRPNQKRSVALWLGGLSAGTLAGATAAILVLANLNGNLFQISPEAVILSEPAISEGETVAFRTLSAARLNDSVTPSRPITQASLTSLQMPDLKPLSSPQTASVKESSLPTREARPRKSFRNRAAQSSHSERTVLAPVPEPAAPPVTKWKTETVEETAYQLVTTAYVTAESGSESGSADLTPVQMRINSEPTETAVPPVSPKPR